ncbi:hypothetical protein ABPG72_007489 [Tetrahymena utriculariae]
MTSIQGNINLTYIGICNAIFFLIQLYFYQFFYFIAIIPFFILFFYYFIFFILFIIFLAVQSFFAFLKQYHFMLFYFDELFWFFQSDNQLLFQASLLFLVNVNDLKFQNMQMPLDCCLNDLVIALIFSSSLSYLALLFQSFICLVIINFFVRVFCLLRFLLSSMNLNSFNLEFKSVYIHIFHFNIFLQVMLQAA